MQRTLTAGNLTDPMPVMGSTRCQLFGPCRKAKHSGDDGFTLIELAIVVLLISLFTMITVPLLTSGHKGDLKASTRRLAGTMKYLFNEAALSGLEHRLVVNLDENSYRGEVIEDDGSVGELEGTTARASLKSGISFTDINLAGRGSFSQGEVTIRIHPSGWLEETVIHLSDEKSNRMTLRVNPLTGSSEVFDGYREFQLNGT